MKLAHWLRQNQKETAGFLLGTHATLVVIAAAASFATGKDAWGSLAAMESMLVALMLASVLLLRQPSMTAWWAFGIGTVTMMMGGLYFPYAFADIASLQTITPVGFRMAAGILPIAGWWITCLFGWVVLYDTREWSHDAPDAATNGRARPGSDLIDISPIA